MTEAPNISTEYRKNFFDTWSEESAYLLGYLEADGSIRYDRLTVRIYFQCSGKDKEFLIKLKEAVGFTGKLGTSDNWAAGKKYKKVRFTVSSRSWAKSPLMKQLRTGNIATVPEEYIHHYIRGYFDGDGSVFWDKRASRIQSNFVFSSEQLAEDFKIELIKHEIKVSNVHKKTSSNHCWYFNISYLQTNKLREFMYRDSSIYMKRKYQKFYQR